VFVHGWKHNAAWDDGNLQSFRELLKGVAHAEDASGTKRKVLGIYVGWRGLGVQIPLLKELTLYTRRTSATHVALGTARELFATLRDLQERRNGAAAAPRRTRLIFVGHSLGGLILYSAFSQYFVSGVEKIPFLEANQQAQSFGDMVVLINPAFEASRYEPLHRVVSQQKAFPSNQRPIFVSITAENDWATKRLHPIFRAVGTVFEEYSVDAQSRQLEVEANLNTMGHISRYRTHELGLEPTPEDAAVRSRESPKQLITQISKHVSAPRPGIWREDCERRRGFYKTYLHQGHLDKNWKWYFNGGARLQHAPGVQNMNENPDNPVWVVKAEKTIVNGHDGIFAAPFLDFLRQLYEIHDDADPGKPDCKSP
jgi:Alpha/beta hydrolase family